MNIKQGDTIRMLSNGEPVRQFLVLETKVCEDAFNALLYETQLKGKPPIERDFHGRSKSEQWWQIHNHSNITWEKST